MVAKQRQAAPNLTGSPGDCEALVERVREKLASKGLTLYRVAALTKARYPQQSAYHIPRNLFFQLRSGWSPAFEQLVALHELTGIPSWDWLSVFGFSLPEIARLQSLLARRRTGWIDSELIAPDMLLPSLRYREPEGSLTTITPFTQLIAPVGSQPASSLVTRARDDFVYAKVGTSDALAFSELFPGSIIRADSRLGTTLLPKTPGELSRHVFLVETRRGLHCGRLRATSASRVALALGDGPFLTASLQIGKEIRVWGAVDLELRFLPTGYTPPELLPSLTTPAATETRQALSNESTINPGEFLRRARIQAGLSFDAASQISREVAKELRDMRYFASPGTLSDYEANTRLPRHIHKLFTLSILYGVYFRRLLASFGVSIERAVSFVRSFEARPGRDQEHQNPDFLERMLERFGDLPLFLAAVLPQLTGLSRPSLRDLFWIPRRLHPLHPALEGALFVLVNRHSKRPRIFPRTPLRLQPVYLLQNRNGTYTLASCAVHADRLTVFVATDAKGEIESPRHIDAEVLGQVVAIVRSVLPP